ncbi:MAG: TIR domain-containing protein [Butyrivibrio sp.]|nr:TIR domain-containing protein [Butyrivibrio sp.]
MYHFNAFISYKHADLDNKVAESIIRDLERYRIPRKIRKSTGIKKIDRVFRDKDELPITSDLNDTISQALINSDFLIVICSTNTKKSTWVEREIEFFLQHHSINNVMTVLADGEPYDVIPKILLSGKKEVTDENGEVKTVDVPYEPLSCDYRLPYKKAKARELPRLVAAIIGCPYDELIDRQRQYKMQRMTAISTGMIALSLGFAGYMYYSNTLIHKNFLESLRSQSKYLANESMKQLENYNRIEALQLALEALPKDEKDERPVTAEAEKAITESLFAYSPLSGMSVGALWNYVMPNTVSDFKLCEDRSKLAIIDISADVIVFDTKTHEELLNLSDYEDSINEISFIDNNTLLVTKDKSISAYNLDDGSCLWTNSDDRVSYSLCSYSFSEGEILLVDSDGNFTEISTKDGSILKVHSVVEKLEELKEPSDDEDSYSYIYLTKTALSEDCKRIAFCATDSSDFSNPVKSINEYNFETGDFVSAPIENESVMLMRYFGDNIYLSCNPDDSEGNSKIWGYSYITDSHNKIRCLSSGDLIQKWEDDMVNTDITINYGFLPMVNGQMAYYEGNITRIWDNETGELVLERRLNDSIIDASDLDENGEPIYITYGGCIASVSKGEGRNGIDLIQKFTGDLVDIDYGLQTYAHGYTSNEIICYGLAVYDEDWKKIETPDAINMNSNENYIDDDVLAIMTTDGGEGTDITIFDPNSRSYVGKVNVAKDVKPYYFELLGSFDGKLYIASDSDGKLKLLGIDYSSLEVTEEILDDDYGLLDLVCHLSGDKLLYCKEPDYEHCLLVERDMRTKEEKTYDLPHDLYSNLFYDSKSQTGFICGSINVIFDLATKTITPVEFEESWLESKKACISSDGSTIAVTNNTNFKLINKKGEALSEFSCKNVLPQGLSFYKNGDSKELLLVHYDNGRLLRYSIDTGELVGTSDTSITDNQEEANISYKEGDNKLYLSVGGAMEVIETDTWLAQIYMENSLGHHEASDTFFSYSYSNKTEGSYVGCFEHYSINDLIQKAKKVLNGVELSDEKKSMYGIAD